MNNAANHNAFYIERNITSWYQDGSLWNRIAGKNGYDAFEGIFPGCYFDMSRAIVTPDLISGSYTPPSKTVIIIGLNNYLYTYDGTYTSETYRVKYNHIICKPIKSFGIIEEDEEESHFYDYGFYTHRLNQEILGLPTTTGNIGGTINEQLYAEFGSHLKTHYDYTTTRTNNDIDNERYPYIVSNSPFECAYHKGIPVKSELKLFQAQLFSVTQISTTGIDETHERSLFDDIFPAFRNNRQQSHWQNTYFLRNMGYAGKILTVNNRGEIAPNDVGKSSHKFKGYVVPYFILA